MSTYDDIHALAVHVGLKRLGVDSYLWVPNDLPDLASITISFDPSCGDHEVSVAHNNRQVMLDDCKVFWNRRMKRPSAPKEASEFDVDTIEDECYLHIKNVIDVLCVSAVSVNPPYAGRHANSKAVQLLVAMNVGFHVKPTVISNDFDEIVRFQRKHAPVVGKCYRMRSWLSPDLISATAMTFEMPALQQSDRWSLEASPLIFQQKVARAMEVRVIAFGGRVFGVKTAGLGGALDGRIESLINKFADIAVVEVPDEIGIKCGRYLEELSLKFGAFDFIVDDHDEWVFLECNESGQWLYLEEHEPKLKLLDHFCRWLIEIAGISVPKDAPSLSFAEVRDSDELRDLSENSTHKTEWTGRMGVVEFDTVGKPLVGSV